MLRLEIPHPYRNLSPVVVTAPAPRCGTTLLQRLLSTARNGFIYGEEVGVDLRVTLQWVLTAMRRLERDHERRDEAFIAAIEGKLAEWRPGLGPPSSVTLKSALETFYQIPAGLAEHARSLERPIWGFKCPGYDHDTLRGLLGLMPQTRVVYLLRNPLDVLRSAKSRRFVTTLEEVRAFCEAWAARAAEVEALKSDPRVLVIRYEALLRSKAAHIAKLEAFTGLRGVDRRAFDLKVNTYRGAVEDGHAPSEYIAPAPLTSAEVRAALEAAGPSAAQFYGDLTNAA